MIYGFGLESTLASTAARRMVMVLCDEFFHFILFTIEMARMNTSSSPWGKENELRNWYACLISSQKGEPLHWMIDRLIARKNSKTFIHTFTQIIIDPINKFATKRA
jgi:hypothetical protein